MKKLIMEHIKAIIVIASLLGIVTAYAVAEALHEKYQDSEIIAGKQDRFQQKIIWYDEQIIDYYNKYGCRAQWVQNVPSPDPPGNHGCKGAAWQNYQQIIWQRMHLDVKLKKMTGG